MRSGNGDERFNRAMQAFVWLAIAVSFGGIGVVLVKGRDPNWPTPAPVHRSR